MSSSDGNIFINDLTTGNELSPFELVATNPTTSLITPNTTKAGYAVESTSFVVGSDRLDNDNNAEEKKDKRMFFDKPKGAFRAGSVVSNQWDDLNRGANSTALGLNNIASGDSSFAAGSSNTASGDSSFAAGSSNTASGGNAIALGLSNQSTSFSDSTVSVAIGNTNIVTSNSQNSVAIGNTNTTGNGNNVVLVGANNTSGDGNKSYAFGNYNNVIGTNSFAIGYGDSSTNNTAGSTGSIAIGHSNSSTGADSVAIGEYCTAYGANSFAIGKFCTAGASNGDGANSVSIGYGTTGTKNTAGNTGSISIGFQNDSTGHNSVAIGSNNAANGDHSFAIGTGCDTKNVLGAICMGYYAGIDTQYDQGTPGLSSQYTFFWNGDTTLPTPTNLNLYASAPGSACFRLGRDSVLTNGRHSEFRIEIPAGENDSGYAVWMDSNGIGWQNSSNRELKENITEHVYADILEKIMEVPVYTYNFKELDDDNLCHGPMADDFNTTFPSTCDTKGISSGNLAGITLSGVKAVKLDLDKRLGSTNISSGTNSVAIGQYCTASGANSVSIGHGIGTTSPDANTASGIGSVTIGYKNTVSGDNSAAIGYGNAIVTGATKAFILGSGCSINNEGASNAIVMGLNAQITHSCARGLFWSGASTTDDNIRQMSSGYPAGSAQFDCGLNSTFAITFDGNTATTTSSASGFAWAHTSDINLKENLVEHTYSDTLDRIMDMPIYTYNFKTTAPGIKSIGPVAQDFNRLFPSDKDQLSIVERDMCGVALAGVKGVKLGLDSLSDNVNTRFASNSDATSALQSRIAVLESSLTTASAQIAAMEGRLAALEQ